MRYLRLVEAFYCGTSVLLLAYLGVLRLDQNQKTDLYCPPSCEAGRAYACSRSIYAFIMHKEIVMFFPFLPQERYKNNLFRLELSRCTFVCQLFSSCLSIIPEGIKTMGPVGFEPTTASAPGKYLKEIKSNQLRWYP